MSTQDVHAPTLGASGEPCATCGALLAADQRYCLNCGARRTDARLAFKEILASNGAAVVGAEGTARDYGVAAPAAGGPPVAPAPGAPPREGSGNRGALAALGGLACLLLALGVGVLIGSSGNDKTATTPPAQVISVGGAAAGTATGASGTTTPSTTTPSSSSSSGSGSSSSGGSGSSTSSGSKATNKNLQNLNKLSTKAYQKQSTKLPKVVGTGGKPPPKDNKPAAGGGSFQSIG